RVLGPDAAQACRAGEPLRTAMRVGLERVGFIALSLLAVGCAGRAAAVRPAAPLPVPGPVIVAHRGGSLEAPENTLAAVRKAIEAGSDWQEVDLRLSK
ncbi:MAG: hypothetical protein GTO30_21205, partial [Acidobacteria bacterium]|nr:hypothetical protein [Acidobacteriota bacterium]NIQ86452.1 hypothetical protein [Acidobacteriota bacterium]